MIQDKSFSTSTIEEIIEDIGKGKMVVLVDDEDRENEGDLVIAADFIDSSAVNFMAMHGRGLICLTLTKERCAKLNLPLMVSSSNSSTPFTLSIEASEGVTTGISASDRAKTIKAAVRHNASASDLVQPGHVFPLMAQEGGVLARAGHTEAGCDLARLAGLSPYSVICEIMKNDGSMARISDLVDFSREHQLKIGTIADLIQFRSQRESIVQKITQRAIHTAWGDFKFLVYKDSVDMQPHLVFIKGENLGQEDCPVRVHEPFTVMDFLNDGSSSHSWTFEAAMRYISKKNKGVVILLNCAKPPSIFFEQLHNLDDHKRINVTKTSNTLRNYGLGAAILRDIGVKKMKLLATPRKMPSMAGYGLVVVGYLSSSEIK
ncbi:MAG: 3,4-dihydroxy-2-butanone-4-phosphate synthase [Betaproteobacteria bacterium TMED41]|nr:MAG: 3,4-dihydroxy-2-butanone-4-phosphate synthase [Betaproteobacteria bacterium TMED41]